MWSFPTACLTRRVCGREVVPGAAVCQGPVPRVPGVHHRCGLPHANTLSRRHHSQVRDMGHGRTGMKRVSKFGKYEQLENLFFVSPDLLLPSPPLFAKLYICWAPSCGNPTSEMMRWKRFYTKEVRNHDGTVHSTCAFISECQCYMKPAL